MSLWKTGVREVSADQHGGASTRFGMSMAMDADDKEVGATVRHWRSSGVFIKYREHSMDSQLRLLNIGPYSS